MKSQDFDKLASSIYAESAEVLNQKASEYTTDQDRLANFKKAGAYQGLTPEAALRGMLTKHLVSISDMIDELNASDKVVDLYHWDEKIIDSINYLILLRGLLTERYNRQIMELPSV